MSAVIEKYIAKIGVAEDTIYEYAEANEIANKHVISFYRNRISFHDVRSYTAEEIASKLAYIEETFRKSFDDAWDKHIEGAE